MILMIDNKGPFTFNLKHQLIKLDQEVEILDIADVSAEAIALKDPAGVILTTGPNDAEVLKRNVAIVDECWHKGIPLLGIGMGLHALAQAFGGKLVSNYDSIPGSEAEVIHDEVQIYEGLASPLMVGRFENLYVDEESLGDDLMITAHTLAGEIMGLRADRGILEGVQFNPESLMTTKGVDLLENFISLIEEK